MAINTVTVDEMEQAVILVYKECGCNLPIKFKIRETAEQLYGKDAIEKFPFLKRTEGAFLPTGDHTGKDRGQLWIYFQSSAIRYNNGAIAGNARDSGQVSGIEAALRVARHEILGHYGINTCSPETKLNILETIVKHRFDSDFQEQWKFIEKVYPELSQLGQAEEVFCYAAETKPMLIENFSLTSTPFSYQHIEQISAKITEGIRLGKRKQLTLPSSNGAQFSKSNGSLDRLSTGYKWSKVDFKMIVSINGDSPSKIDLKVLEKIAAKDKFLMNYSIDDIQSGKLDLSIAKGIQPIPKTYDGTSKEIVVQEITKGLKLN